MGAFFTNFQIRSNSSSDVVAATTKLITGDAYVSPENSGWVSVYTEESEAQAEDVLTNIVKGLSKQLGTQAFGFLVHDSDIAAYWLYHSGKLVDRFNSSPDYFGEDISERTRQQLRGNVEKLLPLCHTRTTLADLDELLHPEDPSSIAEEILEQLAGFLGIVPQRMTAGFEIFQREGIDLFEDAAEWVQVSGTAKAKKRKSPGNKTSEPELDPVVVSIAMLTMCWISDTKGIEEYELAKLSGLTRYQLESNFETCAKQCHEISPVPGVPAFEELVAARNEGPDALAKLLAAKTPQLLPDIAVCATNKLLHEFVIALLKNGLNPLTPDYEGVSALQAGEYFGKDSRIYQILKKAAENYS